MHPKNLGNFLYLWMGGSKLFYVKNGVIFTMIFLEIRVYVAPFFV